MIPFDTTATAPAELKTGGPRKRPPAPAQLNRNPKKHDVVAWRHDGRIDSTKHDTKEAAQEHGKSLPWVTYYQFAVMCGREMVERASIPIPEGMGLDENLMPFKI